MLRRDSEAAKATTTDLTVALKALARVWVKSPVSLELSSQIIDNACESFERGVPWDADNLASLADSLFRIVRGGGDREKAARLVALMVLEIASLDMSSLHPHSVPVLLNSMAGLAGGRRNGGAPPVEGFDVAMEKIIQCVISKMPSQTTAKV